MNFNETARLLNELRDAPSLKNDAELIEYLKSIKQLIGYEQFLVGLSIPVTMTRAETIIVDDYPLEWRKIYDENNLKEIDPVVEYSLANALPVSWSKLKRKQGGKDVDVLSEAKAYGLNFGLSIPIHSNSSMFGMVSFSSSEQTRKDNTLAIVASNMMIPMLTEYFKGYDRKRGGEAVLLTNRELECLKWSAEGKSAWEISKILSCSERTVVFHISNMCNKLGAANKYQAISKAIITGVMRPEY